MTGRARVVVGIVAASVALAAATSPAEAKESQPFRVLSPSGTVFWVRGVAARTWSSDLTHAQSCMCRSPSDAARWAQRVADAWNGQPPTPYVVEPRLGVVTLVYPTGGGAAAVGLMPNALGSHSESWNLWFTPTPQMMRILESGSTDAADRAATPPPPGSSTDGVTWLLVGIAGATATGWIAIAVARARRQAPRAT